MGVDNDAKLIYGWFVSNDNPKISKLTDYEYEEDKELSSTLSEYGLTIDYASPWYDSDIDDRVYYVSFLSKVNKEEIKRVLELEFNDEFIKFVTDFLQEPFEEPEFYCLPHVY